MSSAIRRRFLPPGSTVTANAQKILGVEIYSTKRKEMKKKERNSTTGMFSRSQNTTAIVSFVGKAQEALEEGQA